MTGGTSEVMAPRRAERTSVKLVAMLRQAGARAIEVEVHDLSTDGFQVDTVHVIREGHRVWLRFDGLSALEAEVRWFRNYRIGCSFARPLHPAVLDAIVAAAKA